MHKPTFNNGYHKERFLVFFSTPSSRPGSNPTPPINPAVPPPIPNRNTRHPGPPVHPSNATNAPNPNALENLAENDFFDFLQNQPTTNVNALNAFKNRIDQLKNDSSELSDFIDQHNINGPMDLKGKLSELSDADYNKMAAALNLFCTSSSLTKRLTLKNVDATTDEERTPDAVGRTSNEKFPGSGRDKIWAGAVAATGLAGSILLNYMGDDPEQKRALRTALESVAGDQFLAKQKAIFHSDSQLLTEVAQVYQSTPTDFAEILPAPIATATRSSVLETPSSGPVRLGDSLLAPSTKDFLRDTEAEINTINKKVLSDFKSALAAVRRSIGTEQQWVEFFHDGLPVDGDLFWFHNLGPNEQYRISNAFVKQYAGTLPDSLTKDIEAMRGSVPDTAVLTDVLTKAGKYVHLQFNPEALAKASPADKLKTKEMLTEYFENKLNWFYDVKVEADRLVADTNSKSGSESKQHYTFEDPAHFQAVMKPGLLKTALDLGVISVNDPLFISAINDYNERAKGYDGTIATGINSRGELGNKLHNNREGFNEDEKKIGEYIAEGYNSMNSYMQLLTIFGGGFLGWKMVQKLFDKESSYTAKALLAGSLGTMYLYAGQGRKMLDGTAAGSFLDNIGSGTENFVGMATGDYYDKQARNSALENVLTEDPAEMQRWIVGLAGYLHQFEQGSACIGKMQEAYGVSQIPLGELTKFYAPSGDYRTGTLDFKKGYTPKEGETDENYSPFTDEELLSWRIHPADFNLINQNADYWGEGLTHIYYLIAVNEREDAAHNHRANLTLRGASPQTFPDFDALTGDDRTLYARNVDIGISLAESAKFSGMNLMQIFSSLENLDHAHYDDTESIVSTSADAETTATISSEFLQDRQEKIDNAADGLTLPKYTLEIDGNSIIVKDQFNAIAKTFTIDEFKAIKKDELYQKIQNPRSSRSSF